VGIVQQSILDRATVDIAKDRAPFTERLLSVPEVAQLLQVPVSWVYDHTRPNCSHPLPFLKLGKYLRFQVTEIRAYLEEISSRNGR
jgi:excisionase family DNA binding protein